MLVSRRSFVIIFAGKLGNSLNYYNFSCVRQTRSAIINKIYTHFVNLSVLAMKVILSRAFLRTRWQSRLSGIASLLSQISRPLSSKKMRRGTNVIGARFETPAA